MRHISGSVTNALIEAHDLKKAYVRGNHTVPVLKGVSLVAGRGEFVTVMGPSGSRKSTLLHLLGGLDRPDAGRVILDGVPLESYSDRALSGFRRERLGFVFQFFNLLPSLTTLENIALPLLLDGRKLSSIREKCEDLTRRVGLSGRSDHYPHQLSGGEMQRVAIARALVSDP
ncbi:MAG: ABC transporter ATP-binding protein, partial [Pseudomonadota bacterium]|nr:ABC transporter ATP-binding protein [Pseudomonadota bacterium]